MNLHVTASLAEPPTPAPPRYQIYRQARNGLHYNHGAVINSAEDAVALFLLPKIFSVQGQNANGGNARHHEMFSTERRDHKRKSAATTGFAVGNAFPRAR